MGYFSDLRSQFKTFADISATQSALITELNTLKAKPTLDTTEQARYNQLIALLSQNIVSAQDINNIQHAIENLETFLDNQPLYYRGDYLSTTTYNHGDVVYYDGSAYVCITDNTTNILPSNTAKWKIFVQKGSSVQLIAQRNTVKVNSAVSTVDIGISAFNRNSDALIVHKNGLYLNEGTDYLISADNKSIIKVGNDSWLGANDYDIIFDFCIYKQIQSLDFNINDTLIICGGNANGI